MTDLPILPDWVLIEAAKRCGWVDTLTIKYLQRSYVDTMFYRALCDMIQKYEQPPVDRKLLCAEQAIAEWVQTTDDIGQKWIGLRAIELWEEGFGI